MKKKIKEIYCFGTSFTQGGGFEFDVDIKKEKLLKHYSEKPLTQFNYSWPGQLQKIVGNKIKITNLGKNGFGNERMYRLAYDIFKKSKNLDDKLFIFEFSGLQRKEFWSNTYNTHVITNYKFEEDESMTILGIADTYWYKQQQIVEDKLKPLIEPMLHETLKFEVEEELINMHMNFFIDYMLYNNINFKIVQHPYGYDTPINLIPYSFTFPPKNDANIIDFAMSHNMTITDETNGDIQDGHGGFRWAKIVANIIATELNMVYNTNKSFI